MKNLFAALFISICIGVLVSAGYAVSFPESKPPISLREYCDKLSVSTNYGWQNQNNVCIAIYLKDIRDTLNDRR